MSVMLICVVQDVELYNACESDNLLPIKHLVKQGANVNCRGFVSV